MKLIIRNRITELRGELPLWRLAQRARIPEATLSRVAASSGPGPNLATAFKIAGALDRPIGEVFYGQIELDSEA